MLIRLLPLLLMPALVAAQGVERRALAMGTELNLHLAGGADPAQAAERALAEAARIEAACSTWNPNSSWSRLGAAQGQPLALDREWLELLQTVQAWSQRTQGAFDPVLGALVRAWGVREGGSTPTSETLAAARRASGTHLLDVNAEAGTARLRNIAAGVEEGGFLKGYALDRMKAAAATPTGLLDFGGQFLAWGHPVAVSVADPRNRQQPRIRIFLENASLAGSGTSERGRHLLDPRSGEPCPAWGSVAVVATEALAADVLATALYVMGPQAGPEWAEQHGVAATFLLNDGTCRMTRPFQALNPTTPTPEKQ